MKRNYLIGLAVVIVGFTPAACGGTDSSSSGAPDEKAAAAEAQSLRPWHDETRIVQKVDRTDIVSDQPGVALVTDPNLVNAWGLAFNPSGIAWISSNGKGVSVVYDASGHPVIPPVVIPPPLNVAPPSSPTGLVFNADPTAFRGDRFIFVTENGTIAGWQPSDGGTAVLRVGATGSTAIYKGVTIAIHPCGRPRLYAANFHAGTLDVFDDNYAPVDTTGRFVDPKIPDGFAPFNVQEVTGGLVVTYAKQDANKEDDVPGPGNGFVDLFDAEGNLLARLASRGALNSPWGVALAPLGFGKIGLHLLIGNFGDGRINVYSVGHRKWHWRDGLVHDGLLGNERHEPIVIDGLWALRFGPGTGGFGVRDLYFTAGPGDEQHGLFGRLTAHNKKKHVHADASADASRDASGDASGDGGSDDDASGDDEADEAEDNVISPL